MGEIELDFYTKELQIHSTIFLYGNSASDHLAYTVAQEISDCWNDPGATVMIRGQLYRVVFDIDGVWSKSLSPELILENTNPRNNYFRVEEYSSLDISFVDFINCNTGYFKLANLLNQSTTAAHEYGHSLGLEHPENLDIRGCGQPGIMYPRGTLVNPEYQYEFDAPAGQKGGTLNPVFRKVLQNDIDNLQLHKTAFSKQGRAIIGDFTNVYHDSHAEAW
jgi:hypothetical protein